MGRYAEWIADGIEYLYNSAMEYLDHKYRPCAILHDCNVSDGVMLQINECASAAAYATESYTGETDGRTVL